MEIFVVLFVVVLGVVVIGSIMGMTSSGRITKLEQQNRNLNARLKILESGQNPAAKSDATPIPKPKPAPIRKPIRNPISEMGLQPPRVAVAATAPEKVAPLEAEPEKISLDPPSLDPLSWSPPDPTKPEKPTRSLEELIGGQWSVWVGGLALLVGAVLLIRFSIEAGFFGPGARILMALGLGLVLLLAGEWLKRSDDKVLKGKLGEAAKALQENASVPGLLSAVGIFTLLGASYAAHALYGLIPALAAFIALALISVGAMALSLRQGPLLAGIGLLASLATPLLIQTETPSLLMLIIYLVLVGGAALSLARLKGWGWLATGTVFGWLGWSFMSIEAAKGGQLILWSAFLALGFGVTIWFADQHKTIADKVENKGANKTVDAFSLRPGWALVWAAFAAVLVALVGGHYYGYSFTGSSMPGFGLGLISIAALIAAPLIFRKQSAHLVTAGLLGLVFLVMADTQIQTIILMLSLAGMVILSFVQTERSGEDETPSFKSAWGIFAVALGLVSVALLDMANRALELDVVHTAVALGFTALFVAAGFWLRSKDRSWEDIATPIIGAGLGWALAALLGFEDIAFSVFLSLGGVLAGLAIWRVRLPGSRLVLLGLIGLTFAYALFVQFPDAAAISRSPIFNALWIYLALPAAILAGTAFVLHGRKAEKGLETFLNGAIEAAALAGFALFAVFQIRHLSNGGEVYADSLGHAELGLQVSIGLCFTLAGLSKRFAENHVLSKCAEAISYLTLAAFGLGVLLFFSPFFARGEAITGNIAFNSLTTGLFVPTVLLGLCAVMARGKRANAYINLMGGLALAGALSWVTAMIRFIYNGVKINIWSVDFGSMELWTISVVWLAFGVILLGLGVWRKEQALRIASGVVIILTVLKAFLIDMAGLEGGLRALSFVALGLILIVIGRAYQRYWLSSEDKDKAV